MDRADLNVHSHFDSVDVGAAAVWTNLKKGAKIDFINMIGD